MPVQIDPNIQKTAVRLDANGNEIDPRTKQILKPKESEYVLPTENVSFSPVNTTLSPKDLSITEQIEQAEKHLADLKVLKKAEIERMKAELARLEAGE